MDGRLWSSLPAELLEMVIAKLPVPTMIKLRCVCKTWNLLIHSRQFQGLCSQALPRNFLLLGTSVDYRKASRAYSPLSNKWHNLVLDFPPQIRDQKVYLLASAGGLLCFTVALNNTAAFLVCNPVTNLWKQLPSMNIPLLPCYYSDFNMVTGMIFDRISSSYKIIVVGIDECDCQQTEVYHSSTNSWKRSGSNPYVGDFDTLDGMACGGSVYYIVAGPLRVVAYNFEKDAWSHLEAPSRRGLVQPHLVERFGRLLLIGGVTKNWHTRLWPKPQSVRIWQFNKVKGLWQEIGRMPREVRKKFLKVFHGNYCDFSCIGQANVLYFTRKKDYTFPIVRYDFQTGAWEWLEGVQRVYFFEHAVIFTPMLNNPL